MNTPITFTPSAAMQVKITTAAGAVARTFDMPPVDEGSPDTKVSNWSAHPVWLAFGDGARAEPDSPGTMMLKTGQHALISANEAVLGMGLVDMVAPQGHRTPKAWFAAWAAGVAAATKISIVSHMSGGEVEIIRGVATPGVQF